jgi:hypothetical protein
MTITLGGIAEELKWLKAEGVTREAVLYAVNKVWFEDGEPEQEIVVLVGFTVNANSMSEAQARLMINLPPPETLGPGGSWWIAEDDRYDGSNNDSAVFVPKGTQRRGTPSDNKVPMVSDREAVTNLAHALSRRRGQEFLRHDLSDLRKDPVKMMDFCARLVTLLTDAELVYPEDP